MKNRAWVLSLFALSISILLALSFGNGLRVTVAQSADVPSITFQSVDKQGCKTFLITANGRQVGLKSVILENWLSGLSAVTSDLATATSTKEKSKTTYTFSFSGGPAKTTIKACPRKLEPPKHIHFDLTATDTQG